MVNLKWHRDKNLCDFLKGGRGEGLIEPHLLLHIILAVLFVNLSVAISSCTIQIATYMTMLEGLPKKVHVT